MANGNATTTATNCSSTLTTKLSLLRFLKLIALRTKCYEYFVALFQQHREAIRDAVDQNDVRRLLEIITVIYEYEAKNGEDVMPYTWQLCAAFNRLEMMRSLLTSKLIDPNIVTDKCEWTPLHVAVYQKNVNVIEMLLSHGCNVCARDTNGNTALHVAIQSCQKATNVHFDATVNRSLVIKMVVMILNASQSLHRNNCVENLVNMRNSFGKCALHYAVLLQADDLAIDLMHILLEFGANADIVDARARTPIFYPLSELKFFMTTTGKPLDSPFLNILMNTNCDKLNYNEIISKVCTLKEICRSFLQKQLKSRNMQFTVNTLPNELCLYLNRRVV